MKHESRKNVSTRNVCSSASVVRTYYPRAIHFLIIVSHFFLAADTESYFSTCCK